MTALAYGMCSFSSSKTIVLSWKNESSEFFYSQVSSFVLFSIVSLKN